MKKTVLLLLVLTTFFSCKKDKQVPVPEPEPVKTGNITLKIQNYDSLGQPLSDNSGDRVKLDASNSATTDASGSVVFSNLPFGNYFPAILKDGWEGPPTAVILNNTSVSATLPFAQRSGFKAQNFTAVIVTKDSITVSFNLDKAVPAGKSAKIALIAGKNGLTTSSYESVDIFYTSTNSVNKLNIAKFAKFKSLLAGLDSNATFFINVHPVSYGEYESNLVPKPLLLGENLFAPDNWLLKKDWK